MTAISDQTSNVHAWGAACARRDIRLVAPRRMNAALYVPAPPRRPGTNGRSRVQGERLPQLKQVLKEAQTIWPRVRVPWYNGHGIFTPSGCAPEMGKWSVRHKERRTNAMVAEKVACGFGYQAVVRTGAGLSPIRWAAAHVTLE